MMKKFLFVLIPMFIASPTFAQSLAEQIGAVRAAQNQQEAAQQDAIAAQQQQQQRIEDQHQVELRQVRRAQMVERAQAADAFRVRAKQGADEARAKASDAAADKKRDQTYEDKLREVELDEKLASLQADKIRAARTNDFIDRELAQKSAETDVTKSQADGTRNLTSGVKTLLERTGEAEVKSAGTSSNPVKSHLTGEVKSQPAGL